MNKNLKLALITACFCINAQADNICYIDHLEKSAAGLLVVFEKDNHPYVRGIKRSGSQVVEALKENSALILKEGDEANIYGSPHDTCVIKAEKKENKLGISAVSEYHIPGTQQQSIVKFILPLR